MTFPFLNSFRIYLDRRLIIIFLFGFSSGLPLLLIGSTLAFWCSKVGVDKSTIGLFALVGFSYTLKPLWAPLLDRMKAPFFGKIMGRRRGWLFVTQVCLAAAIFALACNAPEINLWNTALCAVFVAFFSATQDILVDAYRIESLPVTEYTAGGGVEVFGYRIGMIVAGGVALGLFDHYSWQTVYTFMAACMGVGILTTLFCKEPEASQKVKTNVDSPVDAFKTAFLMPFLDFIKRAGWYWIVAFIILYRATDYLIGKMSTVFYQELGFTGTEIGMVTKAIGIWMAVAGGLVGGSIAYRIGIMRTMLWGLIMHVISNGFFLLLAEHGKSMPLLYTTVISQELSGGIMASAFVAYLSRLCNVQFSATQYALFSALMANGRVFVQAGSGVLAESFGWPMFFIVCSLGSIPGLLILLYMMKKHPIE
jgi:PAT family beta-lactamase induction signal transducer AmpG